MSVPTIGILGGIGSGKSSVVRHVTEFRLKIFDADKIGHDLLRDPDVVKRLRQTFPNSVFDADGQVIRPRLARRVFGESADHQAALAQLEQIIHPAIHREIKRQIQAVSTDVDALILDAAILLETGWADECDYLIYVDTPEALRIERVKNSRNWSAEDLARRESSQLPLETKKRRADFIVQNSGTIEDAVHQMTGILRSLPAH